jgi:probable HAF family extracellular repeat protein
LEQKEDAMGIGRQHAAVIGLLFVSLASLRGQSVEAPYLVTEIPTAGGPWSEAAAISDSGIVVGTSATGQCLRCAAAFFFTQDQFVAIDTSPVTRGNQATAINNQGEIVGASAEAFIYRDGLLTRLGTFGGGASAANGINNNGDVVGTAALADGRDHAFLWRGGVMLDLGMFVDTSSYATGINAQGDVVGVFDVANGGTHGFLFRHGVTTDLGTLGGPFTLAAAINNGGEIVGGSSTGPAGGFHAFVIRQGAMIDLDVLPGGDEAAARAINDAGEIVGESSPFVDAGVVGSHAFVYRHGVMLDLNTLIPADSGWVLQEARGINNRGQIVGLGTLRGDARGFVLTPSSDR